jgi:hypothetical protein
MEPTQPLYVLRPFLVPPVLAVVMAVATKDPTYLLFAALGPVGVVVTFVLQALRRKPLESRYRSFREFCNRNANVISFVSAVATVASVLVTRW